MPSESKDGRVTAALQAPLICNTLVMELECEDHDHHLKMSLDDGSRAATLVYTLVRDSTNKVMKRSREPIW